MMIKGKECSKDEENLSAKEKTEKKRTWIQKENAYQEWKKCSEKQTSQRKKKTDCIAQEHFWCEEKRYWEGKNNSLPYTEKENLPAADMSLCSTNETDCRTTGLRFWRARRLAMLWPGTGPNDWWKRVSERCLLWRNKGMIWFLLPEKPFNTGNVRMWKNQLKPPYDERNLNRRWCVETSLDCHHPGLSKIHFASFSADLSILPHLFNLLYSGVG